MNTYYARNAFLALGDTGLNKTKYIMSFTISETVNKLGKLNCSKKCHEEKDCNNITS